MSSSVAFNRVAGGADLSVSPTSGRRLSPKSHIYDAVIDLLFDEPTLHLKEIAARLGRTAPWLTYVMKCDAFRDQYEKRRGERNAAKTLAITEGLQRVAEKSLVALEKKLDDNPAAVTPALALEVADKMLERLGYGVKLPGGQVPQVAPSLQISAEDFQLAKSLVRQVEITHSETRIAVRDALVATNAPLIPTMVAKRGFDGAARQVIEHETAQRDHEVQVPKREKTLDELLGWDLEAEKPLVAPQSAPSPAQIVEDSEDDEDSGVTMGSAHVGGS